MKRLFIILFHICIWIGAVSMLIIAAAGVLMDLHLQDIFDVIILVYLVLGLYISIIAFLYAYCSNNPVHPLRLFVRQIVAFLTLVLSAIPVIMLFLLALHPAGSTDSLVLDAIARIAGFLSPLSVTTLCVYVFVKSLPKIYYKNCLTNDLE